MPYQNKIFLVVGAEKSIPTMIGTFVGIKPAQLRGRKIGWRVEGWRSASATS
jgi:hypothetical protein